MTLSTMITHSSVVMERTMMEGHYYGVGGVPGYRILGCNPHRYWSFIFTPAKKGGLLGSMDISVGYNRAGKNVML